MRLKRLEILGFKSFADKTKLEFDAGITAVVGPNGCGKSNIADAFRWVLGEQSAKSMRGSKMPDVIFAGTSHRKPLNFAEVTITLTDIDGMLPIDYEELSVTRRLHRSGESEYFINRHLVRLKDIQALFLDSGMGKDAYSIFEQGKIDQVINLSPLERRYIFEEAAGILRFLQRKKEALRKLEHTEHNVTRLKDIHSEVERQIIVLEEQAEKAREYKESKRILESLEKGLLVTKWNFFHGRLCDGKRKANDQDGKLTDVQSQVDALQGELGESKLALAAAEKALRAKGEDVFRARSAKEIKSKEKQTHAERLKELIAKEKHWQHELEEMEERKQRRHQERLSIQSAQKVLDTRCVDYDKLVKAQRDKVNTLEESLTELRDQQQIKQKEYLRLVNSENQAESESRQATLRLENALEKQAVLDERKARLAQTEQELIAHTEEQQKQFEEASRSIEGQKELFLSMEQDLQDIAEQLQISQNEIDRINQEISEAKARQKALQRLRDEREGFSAASKRLLEEAALETSPLYNKIKGLYEYFTPEKGAEAALAAVMRPYAQALVVETESDLATVIDFAEQHAMKDIAILCLQNVAALKSSKPKELKGLSPLALHVIENELSRHFLQNVYYSKEQINPLNLVKQAAEIEVCLRDGALIDRRSVIFYATQGENNVFLREAELKALDKKLHESEAERAQIDHVFRTIQQKRNYLQAERAELDKTIRRGEMRLAEMNFGLKKTANDLERNRNESKLLQSELQGLIKIIVDLSTVLDAVKERHGKAKELAAAVHRQAEVLNEQLNELVLSMKRYVDELREKEMLLQQASDEHRKQAHALHVLDVKDLESSQQVKRLQDEIEMGRAYQSQIELKGSEVEKLLEEMEQVLVEVTLACSELEQQVSIRKNALEHLDAKINDRRQVQKKYEAERNQVSIQLAQLESNMLALENELRERHRLTLDEARAECGTLEKSSEQIEKQIRALRQQIEAAGDVNMTSIEECEKHKTRYEFLNQQMDDLNLSKQELVAIIAQLDEESRKIFKTTFDQICINFKKNFKILFNGGDADLQFTETADVLEAGIEIIAQPPGKQMRSINLLSGGEKCLTALALLFAIFEVKPAPFCILDEIDAPLDDTNVERFVNIVKEFIDRCQFIIITHNKRTMAIADVLFGVSMEERGVSKLLTMDFAKV